MRFHEVWIAIAVAFRLERALMPRLGGQVRSLNVNQKFSFATHADYFGVLRADTTRIIASPDGPMFKVPTTTGSPSRMLMSVLSPVLS